MAVEHKNRYKTVRQFYTALTAANRRHAPHRPAVRTGGKKGLVFLALVLCACAAAFMLPVAVFSYDFTTRAARDLDNVVMSLYLPTCASLGCVMLCCVELLCLLTGRGRYG